MTEMQLSDDILKQLNIKDIEGCSTSCKFDEKGTLHIQHRDSEGALKKTTPLREKSYAVSTTLSIDKEQEDDLERLRELNKKSNAVATMALIVLGVVTIGTIVLGLWLFH